MTETAMSAPSVSVTTGGAFYRLVWKWHFLASLYVLPFMAILSITGGLYLFKPQFEAWYYSAQEHVEVGTVHLSMEDQIAALNAAVDVGRLRGITKHDGADRSTFFDYSTSDNVRSYAWVNPYTGDVIDTIERDKMPMRLLKKVHGELLMGKFGTKFVELAANWAIMLFITGAYLWWPRGKRTLKDAISPPKGSPKTHGRAWWRQGHLFVGFLAIVLISPLLMSGLPWTDVWGGGLSTVQKATGQKSMSLRFGGGAPKSTTDNGIPIAMDDVFATAKAEGLAAPYEMRPAKSGNGSFWIRSASRNRFEQSELIIDQYSGDVLKRFDFKENPVIAKAVSLGISFHQGELYGIVNLLQNVLAATVGFCLALSGFVAWWKRRPAGSLGVPKAPNAVLSTGMMILVVALCLFLPLMGASLVVALLLDWLIFRRLGWFQGPQD